MPVINGVYTKDFPNLGRTPADADIIPIAEVANQITYKTTIGAIFNAKISGTTGRLTKFTGSNTVGNSILNESGYAINLTDGTSSYAAFGIINPGTPGDPGIDNDCYIGSTINNDFTIRVNNTEAARFDTALRFKIANIQQAITDTDKFLVSDGGVVKYRTGAEIVSDLGVVTSVGLTMPSAFNVANSPITSSGTLAVTAAGLASQYIRGDGTLADFPTGGGGGGSSVSYYLNGSVNQGTFGGNTYYEMNKTAILGAGTDFNIGTDGYIAQFLTDANDPNVLLIPGGNWNLEFYFSASSGGGTPSFYVELYKYNGTTFSLIASNSAVPELIAFGTTISPYFTSLAVPETVLLATDRLAVRVYVNHSGRTITMHTENSHLCQIITTFTTGLQSLNGLTKQTQYFAIGTSGSDFNIASSVDTHTFNLPTASSVNRGALSSADWSTFNGKQNAITLTTTGSSGASTFISDTLNIPNYTLSGLGGVPTTRQLTINGTAYDLSADRSWSVGTVTSVAALTLGTSGTDLSSTVANGTTTPVITLNVPTASSSNRGALSSTDWTTFNNKVNGNTGIVNYLAKWNSTNTIEYSSVFDNSIFVGINTSTDDASGSSLQVNGGASFTGDIIQTNLTSESRITTTGVVGLQIISDGSTSADRNISFKLGSTTQGRIYNSGNWFIGSSPTDAGYKLDVNGTARFSGALNMGYNNPISLGATPYKYSIYRSSAGNLITYFDDEYATTSSSVQFRMQTSATPINVLTLTGGGNVGIGTTSPSSLLSLGSSYGASPGLSSNIKIATFDDGITTERYGLGVSAGLFEIQAPENIAFFNGSSTTRTERMRITSGGNVLISTTTDNGAKLQVSGSATFNGESTIDGNNWFLRSAAANTDLAINYNGKSGASLIFYSGTAERFKVASTGAATFSSSVTAGGFISSNGSYFRLANSAGNVPYGYYITTSSWKGTGSDLSPAIASENGLGINFFTGGTAVEKMVITSGGNVGIGTTSPSYQLQLSTDSAAKPSTNTWTIASDKRIKENINPYTKGLDILMSINPVTYDYNGKAGFDKIKNNVGIIAQDVIDILPESISTYMAKLNDYDLEETELMNFNSHALTYVLINAIKELKSEIDNLKNK